MKSSNFHLILALGVTGATGACSASDPGSVSDLRVSSISVELIGGTGVQPQHWLGDTAIRVQGSEEEVTARLFRATQELVRLEQVPGDKFVRLRVDGRPIEIAKSAFADVRPALQRALKPHVDPSSPGDDNVGCVQQALAITKCCAGLVAYCADEAADLEGRPGCLWCCDE